MATGKVRRVVGLVSIFVAVAAVFFFLQFRDGTFGGWDIALAALGLSGLGLIVTTGIRATLGRTRGDAER